jgi:hypothetical protein
MISLRRLINVYSLRIITLLVLILNACPSLGATYYISSTGNDNNTGTSQNEAWATVSKVNDMLKERIETMRKKTAEGNKN